MGARTNWFGSERSEWRRTQDCEDGGGQSGVRPFRAGHGHCPLTFVIGYGGIILVDVPDGLFE